MESVEHYIKSNSSTFKGKNVLVTGATGGVGSLATINILNLGANVIATTRNAKKISEKLGRVSNNNKFSYEIIDFEKPDLIKRGVKNIIKKFKGRIDIVIISHGIWVAGGIDTTDKIEFDHALNVNVRSVFFLISSIVPFIKITNGNIVVMSGIEGMIPTKDGFINSISKSMLNSLIHNAALELAPFGVRVNGVAPTIIDTKFRKDLPEIKNKEYLDSLEDIHILNKSVLKPNEVVNTILYLASDDANFVTGEILIVDNGYSLNHDLCFTS